MSKNKRNKLKTKDEKISILKAEKAKQEEYERKQKEELIEIKTEPHHFWRLVWFYFKKPFRWLKENIKDWRTAIIFIIVVLVVSCEVWVPYLIALVTWGSDLSKWLIGVASACWLFWLGPGTPFLLICITLTMVIKGIFNKVRFKNIK